MTRQFEAIAYGRPGYGGVVFGGENVGIWTLGEDWAFSIRPQEFVLTGSVRVHGNGDNIEDRVKALDAILQESGNLGITTGSASVTDTVDVTISSRDVVITSTAATPFLAAHLGLPINLHGIGAYQISEFTSTSSVKCRVPTGIDMPSAAVTQTATIYRTFKRIEDVLHTDGFDARGQITYDPSAEDDPDLRAFNFRIVFHRSGSGWRAAEGAKDTDREAGRIDFHDPVGGVRMAVFTGTITGAGGNDVKDRYDDQISAWITTEADLLLGAASYEAIGDDQLTIDDRKNQATFRAIRQEINVNQTAALLDHPSITDADVGMNRTQSYQHGISGETAPSLLVVTYSCQITRAQAPTGVNDLWLDTIYPHLVSLAETWFGSQLIVTENGMPMFNPVTQRMSARFTAILPDEASSIINYSRKVMYSLNPRNRYKDRWDGRDFSVIKSSPGPMATALVLVTFTELAGHGKGGGSRSKQGSSQFGVFGLGSAQPGIGFGGQDQFGVFGLGAGLRITFGGDEGGGEEGSGSPIKYNPMGKPTPADVFFKSKPYELIIGGGEWDDNGIKVDVSASALGNDPTGISASGVETTTVISRLWRWVNLSGVDPKEGADAGPDAPGDVDDGSTHSVPDPGKGQGE